jgi:hypothetical protein
MKKHFNDFKAPFFGAFLFFSRNFNHDYSNKIRALKRFSGLSPV